MSYDNTASRANRHGPVRLGKMSLDFGHGQVRGDGGEREKQVGKVV